MEQSDVLDMYSQGLDTAAMVRHIAAMTEEEKNVVT